MFLAVQVARMPHPYQCLLNCFRPNSAIKNVVIAASGPYIHTFNADEGGHLSTWPPDQADRILNQTKHDSSINVDRIPVPSTDREISERPQKRQKISPAREDSGSSAEIVVGNGNRDVESSPVDQFSNIAIIKLGCDSTGRHVVAVTGEDKAISVFELSTDGNLSRLSRR